MVRIGILALYAMPPKAVSQFCGGRCTHHDLQWLTVHYIPAACPQLVFQARDLLHCFCQLSGKFSCQIPVAKIQGLEDQIGGAGRAKESQRLPGSGLPAHLLRMGHMEIGPA
mgnify:CR=1 FL=1